MNNQMLKDKISKYQENPISGLIDKDLLVYLDNIEIKKEIKVYNETKNKELLEKIVLTMKLNVLTLNILDTKELDFVIDCLLNKEVKIEEIKDYFEYFCMYNKNRAQELYYMRKFLEKDIINNKEVFNCLFDAFEKSLKICTHSKIKRLVEYYIGLFESDSEKLLKLISCLEYCECTDIRSSGVFGGSPIITLILRKKIIEYFPDSYYKSLLKELLKNKNSTFHHILLFCIKKDDKFNVNMLRVILSNIHLREQLEELFKFDNFISVFEKNKIKLKNENKKYVENINLIEKMIHIHKEMINF